MGLAESVIKRWAPILIDVSLKTGRGGVFRVKVDDEVVFDRGETGRHAEPGEVEAVLARRLGPDIDWR